ncbi:hypothetical protein [Intrasporangium sp.]|uniref:hypothetical protein n=1 Tax=Intrasporangium sp. TaxID=1925024 RepID=UPI00293A839C|nr:hypothetical protein [Intrasporangium sp.]MDV3222444.1 hypothetical protein [Intrasporangium sp.]
MKRPGGIAAASLILCIAAGCASAEPVSRATTAGSMAASTATTSTTARFTTPSTPSPVRVFSVALRSLYQAKTVEYVVESTVQLGENAIRTERKVTVDGDKGLALTRLRLRGEVPGQDEVDLTMRIVNTPDAAYVTMPAWTGSRRGKWMEMTNESALSMGVPLELSAPTTVPPGVEALAAEEFARGGAVRGSIDALPAFSLLGMSGIFKDPDLSSSLIGSVPASVTFDADSGAIATFTVTGKGHDVWSTSESLPPGMIEQVIDAARAKVTITKIGGRVDVSVPAAEDILKE